MKYITHYLIRYCGLLLLLFLLPLSANAEQRGMLWQATPANGAPSYVFGTIHSEDPRVTRLPAKVQSIFNQSDTFCAEMKMDLATQIQMSQGMISLTGQRLDEVVDRKLYEKTVSLVAKYGIPEQMAPMLKPWAAGLMLSIPKPKTGNFLDLMLYQRAEQQGKALCGLEAPEEVIALFDNAPLETQKSLLRVAVREYSNLARMFEDMIKLYLERDLTGLRKYSDRELAKSGKDITALVNDSLVNKRNRNMLQNMQPHLKKGNAFIAVGALHLPGETGLLKLLEKQGYKLRAVY